MDDPLSLLWDGYKVCADSAFRKYMESKEEKFIEGRDYIKDINCKGLLTMATNKYNILKKSGKWGAKSSEEEKNIALSTKLNNLKGKLKLSNNLEAAAVGGVGEQACKQHKHWYWRWELREKEGQEGQEGAQEAEGEAWKKVPPKTGEPHKKKLKGKEYQFYIHHNAWTVHEGKDCHLKKEWEGASTIPNATKTQINSTCQANTSASGNANTMQSFQAILNELLLKQ